MPWFPGCSTESLPPFFGEGNICRSFGEMQRPLSLCVNRACTSPELAKIHHFASSFFKISQGSMPPDPPRRFGHSLIGCKNYR